MNKNKNIEQPIDPKLIEKIELMRPTPERDPELVAKGRERFLAEMGGIPAASSSGWLASLINFGGSGMGGRNRKFAFSTILALIVVAVMLFGGASATAYASQSALPGDALYPIKTGLELTQISLTNDAYLEAQLHLEFARRRLTEITELLLQGRTSDVEFASNEFEYYIQQAMKATQTVLAADPERGAELSNLVSQALLEYAVALKSVLLDVPEAVKPAVEKALLISEDGVGDEIEIFGIVVSISDTEVEIDGDVYLINDLTEIKDLIEIGNVVKIHAILTADGSLIAREIELASDFDDDDDEEFGDDNANSNDGLPSDNDNDNENMNDNESEEDESDDNMNDNESDENENDNESDEDMNENDSDDNTNDNESDDDNENDSESNSGKNDNESEDNNNDNTSEDDGNENDSNDNDNDNESEDNENSNESDEDEEEEENDNDD